MTVQKLSSLSRNIIERTPFTQISNEVILHIKDNDAFRVYCYLLSKSQNWIVIKENVKNICKIGDRKIKQIFSYLSRSNLIQYVQVIDDHGKFVKTDIVVKNGLDFIKDETFSSNKPKNIELSTENTSGGAETARAVSRTCGNAGLLNKDSTKERNKQKRVFEKDQKPKSQSVSRPLPKYNSVDKSKHVCRDTVSDEFKKATRGSTSSNSYKEFQQTVHGLLARTRIKNV